MRVCFVYSNRAEYSILSPFIRYFKAKKTANIIDLSKEIDELESDQNLHKIYLKCYNEFSSKKYDYVCILGDRRELPFIALAAFFLDIKIIHIGAGEFAEGIPAYDQLVRPAISIFSNYQISFSKQAKRNVTNLFKSIPYLKSQAYFFGNPVFKGIKVNAIKRTIKKRYDLVMLHPQSLSRDNTRNDIRQLQKYLNKKTIFIMGNKDKNSDLITEFYKKLQSQKKDYSFIDSLPKEKYFSLVKYCDNFYTNTSSVSEIKFLNKNCLRIIGFRNKNRLEHEFNNNAPELLYKLLRKKISETN